MTPGDTLFPLSHMEQRDVATTARRIQYCATHPASRDPPAPRSFSHADWSSAASIKVAMLSVAWLEGHQRGTAAILSVAGPAPAAMLAREALRGERDGGRAGWG